MARAKRMLGLAMALAGCAVCLYGVALLGWQAFAWLHSHAWVALPTRVLVDPSLFQDPKLAGIAPFVPSVDWQWANHPHRLKVLATLFSVILDRLHLGVTAALAGYALIELGRGIAERQLDLLAWQARERADRLRRIAQYAGS